VPNFMPRAAAGKTMQMIVVTVIALLVATPGKAQTAGAAALAAAVANPVAALISVPIQFNYDQHIGPDRAGDRWTINVQPVIPFTLNEHWNLISRTIAPIVVQDDIFPGSGSQTGLGDIAQSLFFSPRKPTAGGWVWGAGPLFLLPTATDDLMGTKKWGAGPTGVVLRQDDGWSYGVLANHVWSFAGDESRPNLNQSFLQPFLSHTTPEAWTFGVNSESTYNWNSNRWTVPIGVSVSHVMKFGEQAVSLSAGLRYWVESPDDGPQGWGLRFGVAFLFPK